MCEIGDLIKTFDVLMTGRWGANIVEPPVTREQPAPVARLAQAQPAPPTGTYVAGTASGSTASRSVGSVGVADATRTLYGVLVVSPGMMKESRLPRVLTACPGSTTVVVVLGAAKSVTVDTWME